MRKYLLWIVLSAAAAGAAAQNGAGAFAGEPRAAAGAQRPVYWDQERRGWHFYDDPEPEEPPPAPVKATAPPVPPVAAAPPLPQKAPELVAFEKFKQALEDARNIAVVSPTEANVRRYMELENRLVRQASYFSDVTQRVAWATPRLDMTLEGRPVNSVGIDVYDREQQAARSRSIMALGRTHALFFFFRSDCPYCHAFAPILRSFAGKHGLQVVSVSLDGAGLPEFPQFRVNNGIATALRVETVPALFLAQPTTGVITPVGTGVLSESQLVERIATVVAPGADALVPAAAQRLSLQ